ncbi:hypothetical protein GCM10012275_36940 [Longimycelium tulufanense]|uniref:Glutaredoxin n=1 Tax=Longimycelium tulufanense TaxID=907463 RepID=A0A8J3C9X3_9PSEU|nr:hypothetical protein [Longimycelium tulufanense]GGM62837.1 hypothetical protein GCM10012275_36940 [Longimycelium tulufanense]
MATRDRRPPLRIYVAPGCSGCRTARTLAETVRHARPGYPVEVVDLAERPGASLPEGVIGVPTYLLGEVVVSLGNPEPAELLRRLDSGVVTVDDD